MHLIDWLILIPPSLAVVYIARCTQQYNKGVAMFLYGGRVAGRYVVAVAMIPRLNEALGYLEKARSKALPGSLGELDYVIFKTESYILHLKTLCAWLDGIAAYDRVVEVKNWNDNAELEGSIRRCKDAFLKARDVTHQSAKLIAEKAKHGDDKYILFRYNFGLVTPIDELCGAMEKWTKPGDRK